MKKLSKGLMAAVLSIGMLFMIPATTSAADNGTWKKERVYNICKHGDTVEVTHWTRTVSGIPYYRVTEKIILKGFCVEYNSIEPNL